MPAHQVLKLARAVYLIRHSCPRTLCFLAFLACCAAVLLASQAVVQGRPQGQTQVQIPTPADIKPGSINLEDVPYPHPVSYLPLTMYGQDVRLAYMDVVPAGQGKIGRAHV